ncbi:Glycosyl hydrolase family 1, partial [Phytophthora infestans]
RRATVFADDAPRCFPADFMFGSATASYQVEGAWNEGGRTPSIWDDFCRTHHRTKVVCANVADAFYHRYRDNVKLMVDTGLQSSRFSVSWSRAMNWNPETKRMQLNPHGLAFYHALVDELITNNIVPILTLYHWDLPLELHTELSLFKAGCTQTSSTTTSSRAEKSDTFAYIVAHNVLRSYAAVVKAFRDLKASSPPVLDQKARIGITLNSDAAYSLDEKTPLDVACSGKEDAVRTVLVPLTSGYWRLSGNHAGTSGLSLAEIHNRGDGAIEGIVQQQALSSSSWRPTQPVPTTKYGRFFLFHSGVVDATSSFIRDEAYRWIHELHTEHHLVGLKVDTAHFTTDAEPGKEALHVPKLRLVFIKEHRQGAISMVSQLGLYVLAAVGSKLIVYEFKSEQLIGCVLYDSADKLALLAVDMDENLHVMQLAPQNYRVSRWPASAASERLPLGCPSLGFVPEAGGCVWIGGVCHEVTQYSTFVLLLERHVYVGGRCHPLVPVGKGVFRRLFKLQNDMVNTLPQNCALKTSGTNAKRRYGRPDKKKWKKCFLDAFVLCRFLQFAMWRRRSLHAAIGTTPEG